MLPGLSTARLSKSGFHVVFLHWLGGSSHAWTELCDLLQERGVRCTAVDLPGFGEAHDASGFGVAAMRDAVIATVRTLRADYPDEPWMLAGHSMGGKVAAAVARAAVDGEKGLENLRAVVLFSPSPPRPEPMEESKRTQMLQSLGEASGDGQRDRKQAEKFVDENTGKLELPVEVRERTVADVLRMNRTAFRMWLERGSKEDWREPIGVLPMSALVFAGSEEEALGEDAQRVLMLPHFQQAELVILRGAGHLSPMERPRETGEQICEFALRLGLSLPGNCPSLGESFLALLKSDRTSPQTREVMEARQAVAQSWEYVPRVLSQEEFGMLRALAARVVPGAGFDAAALVEGRLADGNGDGWRFATLPTDAEAWQIGLRSLDAAAERRWGVGFIALDDERMDELLREGCAGDLGKGVFGALHFGDSAEAFGGSAMKQWLEDVRGEFAKCYMAHPGTMERVGFTGFADEGGFTQIRIGEREEFER